MAKRVFFSFHYQDVSDFRANVVRNHWLLKSDRSTSGFFDASIWETAKKTSSIALKRLINAEIQNTSVTCILIGSYTWSRPWVRYEILKSFKRGNHIIGIHINSIKCKNQNTKLLGLNPLDYVGVFFSNCGMYATLYEKIDGRWESYTEIDGTATYRLNKPVYPKYRNVLCHLSEFYFIYDWIRDYGHENFAIWINYND